MSDREQMVSSVAVFGVAVPSVVISSILVHWAALIRIVSYHPKALWRGLGAGRVRPRSDYDEAGRYVVRKPCSRVGEVVGEMHFPHESSASRSRMRL